jgi:hypothetical protein
MLEHRQKTTRSPNFYYMRAVEMFRKSNYEKILQAVTRRVSIRR